MVYLWIDEQEIEAEEGTSVLEAARKAGNRYPNALLSPKTSTAPPSCRICIVQVEGRPTMDASCVLPVEEG